MIGKIKGNIEDIKPAEILIDVNGVCYQLLIPFTVYENFKSEKQIELLTYLYVREDQLRLYGFHNSIEKKIFELLIKISGIGPSMALSIISGIGVRDFVNAIKLADIDHLIKIPGIGKSKAEKLIFELKRKIDQFNFLVNNIDNNIDNMNVKNEAMEALISLGFDEKKIIKTIDDLISIENNISVEELVRKSLQHIGSY